jgi:uncharacterized protein YbjT (DUF2867 family)
MDANLSNKDLLLIVGASGKLGFATLTELLNRKLLPASQIACTTSSDRGAEKLAAARQAGVELRRASWDDSVDAWVSTLRSCTRLFLISSSRAEQDYDEAPDGKGREAEHIRVLEAAKRAGVQHVYYTSLAFANPSLSRVMKAHERTEVWLHRNATDLDFTILREGLYSESWPLYLGYWDLKNDDADDDKRSEVLVAGDGQISWTSLGDLGLANAAILAAPRAHWSGRTCNLVRSTATYSLTDVARMVSKTINRAINLRITTRASYEDFYSQERGIDRGLVTWWSPTYDALTAGECDLRDDSTLDDLLLQNFDARPKDLRTTIEEMLASSS